MFGSLTTSSSVPYQSFSILPLPSVDSLSSAPKIAPCRRPSQQRDLSYCQLSAVSCQPLFSFSQRAVPGACVTAFKSRFAPATHVHKLGCEKSYTPPPLTLLESTCRGRLASIDSKQLTETLNPLNATLTENQGVGILPRYIVISLPRPSRTATPTTPIASCINFTALWIHRGTSPCSRLSPSRCTQLQKHPLLSPFFATLTDSAQLHENKTALTPVVATLTRLVHPNPFVCHSYKKTPGVGGTCFK
jgi:hypothetical protein